MIFHVPTFVRFVSILSISFLLSAVVPLVPTVGQSANSLIHIMLVFSLLISFLINRALDRKMTINSSVSTELSRLRRIHHLGEKTSHVSWKSALYKLLEGYHTSMGQHLLEPKTTAIMFRKLTHHVYGFSPKTVRDEHLFDELLESTREIGIERQRRDSAVLSKMAGYSWMVMGTYAMLIVFLLLCSREEMGFSAFSVGATITGILLVMDLLYRLNKLSRDEIYQLQQRYYENKSLRD